MKQGQAGLDYGMPAHLLDAGKIFRACWENLPSSLIVNCWNRSKCLNQTASTITKNFIDEEKEKIFYNENQKINYDQSQIVNVHENEIKNDDKLEKENEKKKSSRDMRTFS